MQPADVHTSTAANLQPQPQQNRNPTLRPHQLLPHAFFQRLTAPAGQQVWVQAQAAQHCYGVLGGLGLLLAHHADDGHQAHVHGAHVAGPNPAGTRCCLFMFFLRAVLACEWQLVHMQLHARSLSLSCLSPLPLPPSLWPSSASLSTLLPHSHTPGSIHAGSSPSHRPSDRVVNSIAARPCACCMRTRGYALKVTAAAVRTGPTYTVRAACHQPNNTTSNCCHGRF